MDLIMNFTPLLVLLFTCVKVVSADVSYIGSTIAGIVGLIVLVLDVIAAVEVLRSGKTVVEKVLWILFIFFFPIIGLIVYLLCGRSRAADL